MKEQNFSMEELHEMDAIQIRGGDSGGIDIPTQKGCRNEAKSCGAGVVVQIECVNAAEGCSDRPIVNPIRPQVQCGCSIYG